LPDPTPPRAAADARRVEVIDLGRAAYGDVLERMRARHAAVQRGEADGVVWLVEHEPVYTAGRATPAGDLRPGIVPIERGGKITYHGPGQLTVYPLVRLPRRDVRDWLRRLERFGVRIAARFGLAATPSVDGTGVFVGDRKFASIGVHVKGWVNLHGIGVNVAMDLAPWHAVRPCGLAPDVMTDLSRAAGRPIAMAAAAAAAAAEVSVLVDPDGAV
jgi:lipoate-protein ligase B